MRNSWSAYGQNVQDLYESQQARSDEVKPVGGRLEALCNTFILQHRISAFPAATANHWCLPTSWHTPVLDAINLNRAVLPRRPCSQPRTVREFVLLTMYLRTTHNFVDPSGRALRGLLQITYEKRVTLACANIPEDACRVYEREESEFTRKEPLLSTAHRGEIGRCALSEVSKSEYQSSRQSLGLWQAKKQLVADEAGCLPIRRYLVPLPGRTGKLAYSARHCCASFSKYCLTSTNSSIPQYCP
jgi:hypothetical protein